MQYFQVASRRIKAGNPRNQRIGERVTIIRPRVLANQLCALDERSAANEARTEPTLCTPFRVFFFLSPLLSYSRPFICPPSFCTSNAISAVNVGCAPTGDYNGSACTRAANEIRKNQAFGLRAPERRLLNDARLKPASVFSVATASLFSDYKPAGQRFNPLSASAVISCRVFFIFRFCSKRARVIPRVQGVADGPGGTATIIHPLTK